MPEHLGREQSGRPQGSRDAQALVAGGEPHISPLGMRANQRQAIRCRGAKAGPDTDTLEQREVRKIFECTHDHSAQDVVIHVTAMIVELS